MKVTALYLVLWCFLHEIVCEICSNSVNSFENHLASKTPYRVVANNTFGKLEYEGCQPLKIWMLARHGTRTPSANLITNMQTRLVEIRNAIIKNNPIGSEYVSNADLDLFKNWETTVKVQKEKRLTYEGQNEMVGLAERMQSRFPSVLHPVYSNTSYQFKYTDSQRTRKSAKYFTIGLFGKNTVKDVWYPEALKRDPILRFYKLCSKWRSSIKKNSSAIVERKQFENISIVKEMLADIADRLHLDDVNLSFGDAYIMYMTCAFETAWTSRQKSPWCSVFTVDEFKLMEYAEDLKYYWIDGYGHELTYKQACPAFNDFINMFKSEETYPKVTVYFTHSGTILKMLAHLGLYRDSSSLRAANYKDFLEDRKWRVGKIDAFASNIAFILHRCGNQQKVLTLHQERIVRLPPCQEDDLCDIENIDQYYRNSIEQCNFDQMCENTI